VERYVILSRNPGKIKGPIGFIKDLQISDQPSGPLRDSVYSKIYSLCGQCLKFGVSHLISR